MDTFDGEWVGRMMAGSAGAAARPGRHARVALAVGSEQRVVLEIRDGRITGTGDDGAEPDVEVPLSPEQAEAVATGELSLAVAYMRGDVKPVGSSGALAVWIEVAEDPATWSAWRS